MIKPKEESIHKPYNEEASTHLLTSEITLENVYHTYRISFNIYEFYNWVHLSSQLILN